jgi:DNA-binding transcriptional LysR family regulator
MEYKNLPDVRSLATLKAVVELGGVEEAGKKLHVGQPAVTKRLRALDKCYGQTLMQRKRRRQASMFTHLRSLSSITS